MISSGGMLTLIKSVLEAMPTYLLALIQPPKAVVHVRFFWHDSSGQHKYHWIKWTSMCCPLNEVGVGLRSMKDIAKAYAKKRWCRFRENNTLWAKYLQSKYCSIDHPAVSLNITNASSIWKCLLAVRSVAKPHMKWLVGKRDIDVIRNR